MTPSITAAYVDSPIPLNPCHHCKAPAEIFRGRDGKHMAECSDTVACKQWPQTKQHDTAEAWNKGEVQ